VTGNATTVELGVGDLRLSIVPGVGGGVARFDRRGVPVFRPWDDRASRDPNGLGCYPLVPWSNRVSAGGIEAGGRLWPLLPNLPGEPYPIHGDGWQAAWEVVEASAAEATLAHAGAVGPHRYRAELGYALAGSTLTMRLSVEHRGDTEAPYGLGFHPWLPRTPGTTLHAAAPTVWLETPDHLPAGAVPVGERAEWDFRAPRRLPRRWVNNGFSGWDGRARVAWPEHGLALDVEADPPLSTFILYSPSADAGFFCFEPASHPVDAFHLPGMPGLRILATGERLTATCRLTVRESGP
jgi:aldose 1-epimerase